MNYENALRFQTNHNCASYFVRNKRKLTQQYSLICFVAAAKYFFVDICQKLHKYQIKIQILLLCKRLPARARVKRQRVFDHSRSFTSD